MSGKYQEGAFAVYTKIQKFGDSSVLHIPTVLLDALGIRENDRVELSQSNDSITIKKAPVIPHRTLEERLTAFYGKPLDEIGRIDSKEFDWGPAKGAEQW